MLRAMRLACCGAWCSSCPRTAALHAYAPDPAARRSAFPAPQTSVWYGCVLRGDLNHISVGAFSNIQDRSVLTAAR